MNACPKRMTYGPCGGVDAGGGCEVEPLPCPFVRRPTVAWDPADAPAPATRDAPAPGRVQESHFHALSGQESGFPEPRPALPTDNQPAHADAPAGPDDAGRRGHPLLNLMATRPIVLADLPAPTLDATGLRRVADLLAGSVDAVLLGDHPGARVQFPPSYRALLLRDAGVAVWAGLNCRDRNRVALQGELAALAEAGAAAVHCVTGDHPTIGHRPDAAPVFDLDSTRLAAAARAAGLLVSVGEAPVGPPVARRPARLAEKVRAGAQVCIVNHAGGVDPVRTFVEAGPAVPYLACVPVVLGAEQAARLAAFPGMALPAGFLSGILDAPDPATAGIDAAVRLAEAMLGITGVRGVDIAALPVSGAEDMTARALATVGRALR